MKNNSFKKYLFAYLVSLFFGLISLFIYLVFHIKVITFLNTCVYMSWFLLLDYIYDRFGD